MNCLKCQNQVTETTGYETESGGHIHHGCAMLMDKMPRRKTGMSLADMLAAKAKVDAKNAAEDSRNGR